MLASASSANTKTNESSTKTNEECGVTPHLRTLESMKFAAIDIGSNALRLLIKVGEAEHILQSLDTVCATDYFERIPLKSGNDTFTHGLITQSTEVRLTLALHRFAQIMQHYGVERYRACATSAYRDASNGHEVMERANKSTGLNVEIISGEEEARLTRLSFISPHSWANATLAFADVGGGSTEISLLHQGELQYAHSFRIGSMRKLKEQPDFSSLPLIKGTQYKMLAVGGSIRFLYSYIHKHKPDSLTSDETNIPQISLAQLEEQYALIAQMSAREISDYYNAPLERAEILKPAVSIFLSIVHTLGADTIYIPSIGVRTGIIADLLAKS